MRTFSQIRKGDTLYMRYITRDNEWKITPVTVKRMTLLPDLQKYVIEVKDDIFLRFFSVPVMMMECDSFGNPYARLYVDKDELLRKVHKYIRLLKVELSKITTTRKKVRHMERIRYQNGLIRNLNNIW